MSRERPEDRSIQSWMAELAIHAERVADGIDELNAVIRAKVATGPGGMSLREWFAGMAIQGLLACPDVGRPPGATAVSTREELTLAWAKFSYAYADAMLAAREQK